MRRLPETPPTIAAEKLLLAIKLMENLDVKAFVNKATDEYYHWEKVRHLPIPNGLDAQDAWAAVKVARLTQRVTLPLVDHHGRPFHYGVHGKIQEQLHEIDRWSGTNLALPEVPGLGSQASRDRIIMNSLMEEAIATAQIEGAATTRQVAKRMLQTKRLPRDRSERMIANSFQTIRFIKERIDEPLSTELLFDIQQQITEGTLEDETATRRYRKTSEHINIVDTSDGEVIFTPPAADLLDARMKLFFAYANQTEHEPFLHPLIKAAILHFWLAYEHPFVDGNGRTARALLYWYMLKQGYSLFEFLTISRAIAAAPAQYYRSFLHSETDDNDATYSIMFQVKMTKNALTDLRTYLKERQTQQGSINAALRKMPGLNHRQRSVIEDALRYPDRLYTFQGYQAEFSITYVTARNDLLALKKLNLLEETKIGRQRAFIPVEYLAESIEAIGC